MIYKFIIPACLILVGAGYFLLRPNYDTPPEFSAQTNELPKLKCDLNLEPCELNYKGKIIKFEFNQKPITAMQPVIFKIYGLDQFGFSDLGLEFYGLNMDMGKIRAKLSKNGDFYSSKIVLSSCVIDTMRYRFELTQNGKSTGIFADFDLKI